MRLSDFEALSFDCYGTLVDWDAGISAVLLPWAAKHGLEVSAEKLLGLYAEQEARVEAAFPRERYPQILARSFAGMGDELGTPVTSEDAERLATSVPNWPLFPDSHEALTALSEHYKLIILSNIDRETFSKTNEKLDVVFDEIITAEDVGSYKPSQRNFDALLARIKAIGVGKDRLLHVAESLFHDHVPAKNNGLHSVRILRQQPQFGWGATPRPADPGAPDWEFSSMAEFAQARVDEAQAQD